MHSPQRRIAVAVIGSLAIAFGLVAVPTAAMAYATSGAKWLSSTLTIDYRYVNGNFRTALSYAKSNYNSATDVTLSLSDSAGPSWTAANTNYGATGWEGQASVTGLLGVTWACDMRLNQYYLSGSEPVTRLKVVWEHEMGHCLGLSHVSSATHVMYTSASTAYFNGVTALTTDDRNGINYLY